MSLSAEFTRGADELRRLLAVQTHDLRNLDLAGFRQWLELHLNHWRRDPVFVQRARIRRLRQTHPNIHRLERELHRLAAADAASRRFFRLKRLERELSNTDKAIAGLSEALEHAPPGKQEDLERKRRAFQDQRQNLESEQAALVQSSPERRRLLQAESELQGFRISVGLDQEESRLRELLTQRGRRRGRRGESFEQSAAAVVEREIAPELALSAAGEVRVLRQVTLGAAKIEFDLLVVRRPHSGSEPVDVLAVVETKRNINDLAHGFRRWQENLAWLTGDAGGYDPEEHRTRWFPTGRFDRGGIHRHAGESYRLARESFRRFGREADSGLFLNRLYFMTRVGPLWGVSSRGLARIAHRAATDPDWDIDDEAYLRGLMRWAQSLANPLESSDVLRFYLAARPRARQILLATPPLA